MYHKKHTEMMAALTDKLTESISIIKNMKKMMDGEHSAEYGTNEHDKSNALEGVFKKKKN